MPKVKSFRQVPDLPKLEKEIISFWKKNKIFEKSINKRPKDNAYVFYDGPPFATGMPHYGHLLASTTKDVIPRFQTMLGKRVRRVWGWDCHGLPIENIIENKLDIEDGKQEIEKLGIEKFNQACRSEVLRLDKEWKKTINRIGRWVDFENSYKTMSKSYMESVWWGFKQLAKKDLIYQGRKVILYCPRCGTPLSNFEIAMDNSYKQITEASTVYKYPIKDQKNTYLLAWSTTPWNKLATPALAVNPDLMYIKIKQGDKYYVLTQDRLEMLKDEPSYKIVDEFKGSQLQDLEFELHYDFYPDRSANERVGVVVTDDFVTADEGTGVVTLAAYGEDDYRVMKEHQIQIVLHVDEEGKLKKEVEPWAGTSINEVNKLVNRDLRERGLIYSENQYTHTVPVCHRCETRLYYAPVPAWFIDIQSIKDDLIEHNEKINWVPKHLKHGRFLKGLESAPDWNISRSRYWGTPMPIWQGKDENNKTVSRIIGSVAELQEWAVDSEQVEEILDLHREFIDEVKVYVDDERTIVGTRVPEVFDCWVESGSMPFAHIHYPFEHKDFFEENYPAQFVSEYIAQTRAWFYTMHVMSVAIFEQPPFENVLTTGTILAEDGTKMSKSKKNFPDPSHVLEQYGADSLRLYLMSSPVMKAENLNFSEQEVADLRRRVFLIWWNMISFYKMFADQEHDITTLPTEPEHILDQWLVSRINSLRQKVTTHLKEYDVVKTSRSLIEFVNDFSTWYLRLSRERIKQDENQEVSRVFGAGLHSLAQLFAPLCPFFSELSYHNLVDENSSIHLTDWPEIKQEEINEKLESEMAKVTEIVELGRGIRRDKGLKLRHPLASAVIKTNTPLSYQDELSELIKHELNIKEVYWEVEADQSELKLEYDFDITPDLKQEAEVRDLIREIQNLRRKAKLDVEAEVVLQLPDWPENWQEEIETKTNTQLVQGDEMKIVQ